MAVIQYSGNVDDPYSFSTKDMERLIKMHNETIDAILFIVNYTNRANKSMFKKALDVRGLDELGYCDLYPQNVLISCVGMANELHKKEGRGPYEPFSSLSSLKIRNSISEYEEKYKQLTFATDKLQWTFQHHMILAFDKFYAEVKKFQSKYKHVPKLHKILAELQEWIDATVKVIGSPEIEYFNGTITMSQVNAVRNKLSEKQTPIVPVHLYNDIMRFEAVKETMKDMKREHSRQKHYDNIQNELDIMSDKNIELAQANADLAKANNALQSEKQKLIADNQKMAQQIANVRSSFVGRILFNLAQKTK